MSPAEEKQLRSEIEILKRRTEMLMDRLGMRDIVLDEYRYNEALDRLHETGDRSLLDEYFLNKKRSDSAA